MRKVLCQVEGLLTQFSMGVSRVLGADAERI
jgi:hypothetical protein